MRQIADYTDAFAAPDANLYAEEQLSPEPRRIVRGRILRDPDDAFVSFADLPEPSPIDPGIGSSGPITIAQTRAFLKNEADYIPTENIRWRKRLEGETRSNSIPKPRSPRKKPDGRIVVLIKHPPKTKRFTKLSNRDR